MVKMKMTRVLRDGIVIALAFAGLQALEAYLMRDVFDRQNQISAHRLAASTASVLTRAHLAKDDVGLLQAITALDESPGIIQACIVDSDGKILAHRQPAQIGKILALPRNHPNVYAFPLHDGTQIWGNLVLFISERLSGKLLRHHWWVGTTAAALLWIALFVYLRMRDGERTRLKMQIQELTGFLDIEKRNFEKAEVRAASVAEQLEASLKAALQRIADPMIVLDAQQRIAAYNPSAVSKLGIALGDEILGKSWHEVAVLNFCGAGLERSLEMPGQPVSCAIAGSPLELKFEYLAAAGTWVTLSQSNA